MTLTNLNAMTGTRNWAFFTGDELYISPSYADGKIYVVTSQKDIFILDANHNGAKLATYQTPSSTVITNHSQRETYIGMQRLEPILLFQHSQQHLQRPSPSSQGTKDISQDPI